MLNLSYLYYHVYDFSLTFWTCHCHWQSWIIFKRIFHSWVTLHKSNFFNHWYNDCYLATGSTGVSWHGGVSCSNAEMVCSPVDVWNDVITLFISNLMSLLFGSFFSIDNGTSGLNFSMILFEKGMLCCTQRGSRYQLYLDHFILSDNVWPIHQQSVKVVGGTDSQGRMDVPCLKKQNMPFCSPISINLGWYYLSNLDSSKLYYHKYTRTNHIICINKRLWSLTWV